MAEKQKKKPSFFILKRWNSQRDDVCTNGHSSPSPVQSPTIRNNSSISYLKQNSVVASRAGNIASEPKSKRLSAGGIKDLIQCALCLEVLHNPKMLPCQHTFCLACLKVYSADEPIIDCPICRTRIQILGSNYVESLPSNLYIDTLLSMVGISTSVKSRSPETPPVTPTNNFQSLDLFAGGVRCSHCKTMCDSIAVTFCDHCKLNFCHVCWSQHLDDMRTQIGSILKQLDSASSRLEHKIEHYKDRCEHIMEQIKVTAEEKINAIKERKNALLGEVSQLQKNGDLTALALRNSLDEAKEVARNAMTGTDDIEGKDRVKKFMNLHQNTLQILSDVSRWDSESFVFDKENFRMESDASTPLDAESDEPLPQEAKQNNPLESEETLVQHYRSRNFEPHYMWRKTSRPSGVGINPWNNHLYICGLDSHSVLVVERSHAKIVTRLSCEEMLCPVHIAFMKSLGEIYVTDKWKHCIHVFSKDGVFIRSMGQKGSRHGMFRSPEGIAADNSQNHIYVVDTGNDRVQILTHDGKFVDQIGVATRPQPVDTSSVWENTELVCTEFNAPTSVALTNERIIILDSGNRRVKIYNKQDKGKILEFGSLGSRKGQFRQPEVLTVDPMGFILVGDSGNCRVQVFKPNGQLVRVFGRLGTEPGKFGWISGIHVTKQLDIIVSDTKNHCVNFF